MDDRPGASSGSLTPARIPHAGSVDNASRVLDFVQLVSDARFAAGLCCVHCSGPRVIGWGRYRERCRYRCRDCGRTFNALSGTPFAYSKKLASWPAYLAMMRAQTTLRRAALRLDVHLSTSFRWRHRFLGSGFLRTEPLSGYVELREALFPYSEKGSRRLAERLPHERGGYSDKAEWTVRRRVRVLFLIGRNGSAAAAIFLGRLPALPQVVHTLRTLIAAPAAVLIAEPRHSLYRAAVAASGHKLESVPRSPGRRGVVSLLHVANARNFERRFRSWLLPFRGVATRYLENYLAWHRFADRDDIDGWLGAYVAAAVAVRRPEETGS